MNSDWRTSLIQTLDHIAQKNGVEFADPPKSPRDAIRLRQQFKVREQLIAIYGSLRDHAPHDALQPLYSLVVALDDLVNTIPNPLLTRVKTKGKPKGARRTFPEHWGKLRDLCCDVIIAFMETGLTRRAAAQRVDRRLRHHDIVDPSGKAFKWETIARWEKEPESRHSRRMLLSKMRTRVSVLRDVISGQEIGQATLGHNSWKQPEHLLEEVLIRWRWEAEQLGYKFGSPRSLIKPQRVK